LGQRGNGEKYYFPGIFLHEFAQDSTPMKLSAESGSGGAIHL
jgi:hypothetical protein